MGLLEELLSALSPSFMRHADEHRAVRDVLLELKSEIKKMSQSLSDYMTHMDGVMSGMGADIASVKSQLDAQSQKIADLQAQLSAAGALTPDVQAHLQALSNGFDTMKATLDGMVTAASTPAPAPTPVATPDPNPAPTPIPVVADPGAPAAPAPVDPNAAPTA